MQCTIYKTSYFLLLLFFVGLLHVVFNFYAYYGSPTCLTLLQVIQHDVILSSHSSPLLLYIPSLSVGSRRALQGYDPSAMYTPVLGCSQSAPVDWNTKIWVEILVYILGKNMQEY